MPYNTGPCKCVTEYEIYTVGKPDPPTDLSYSLLESSVELKWNRPSYTGGNKILGMMYNVTANGKTYPVQNGSVAVKYTSPDLIHGDIKVTAINQCEQESMPAIVKIPTAGNVLCAQL